MYIKKINFILLLGMYLITLACNEVLPLISDDFAYQKLGLNLSVKWHHYLDWSGRLVADFISSAILQLPDRNLMSFINAIPVVVIIYISALIGREEKKNLSTSALILCFVAYIAFNPALGQTTFWIVGAANYLWTSMLCLVYMLVFYRVYDEKKDNILILVIVSFLAGCTNESSSVILAVTSVITAIYFWLNYKHLLYKAIIISASFIIGSAILVLSPGNEIRMAKPDFADWRSMSFIGHLKLHMFERIPATSIPIVYSYILILLLVALIIISKTKIHQEKYIKYVAIPISISLAMAFVMFLSPYFPPRSLNMSLVVNLIPIAFLVSNLCTHVKITLSIVSLAVLFYLLPGIYSSLSHGLI